MTKGEKWLNEVRIIHYLVVLPIAIFPGWGGRRGKQLSDRGNTWQFARISEAPVAQWVMRGLLI